MVAGMKMPSRHDALKGAAAMAAHDAVRSHPQVMRMQKSMAGSILKSMKSAPTFVNGRRAQAK